MDRSIAWGDYDGDGNLDLYVSNGDGTKRLYQNDGDATFTDVASSAGVDDSGNAPGVAWGDYDKDGDLDLYINNFGTANRLYRNDGSGTFTEVGASASVDDGGSGRGVAWGDYDDDGDLDIYVVNASGQANRLYSNDGDGTFTEVGSSAGVNDTGDGHGGTWGDYDNDGDLDLYVSNFGQANRLYRNDGAGTFTAVGSSAGVNDSGNGTGVAWGDYDNDGDLDVYVAIWATANRLYSNDGDGTFTETGSSAGVDDSGNGTAVSWGDYDDDGDIDLYAALYGTTNLLYRNNGTSNQWLIVKLVGTASSKDGIGAQVTAVTGATRQRRDMDGGSWYQSQPSLPLEFGFGGITTVDSLIVRWPSGTVQIQTSVSTNQVLTVTEPTPAAISLSPTSLSFGNVNVGSSGPQTLTVSNTGGSTLNVTGITVSGTDAAEFSASPTSFNVNAGGNQDVTVTFSPTSTGSKSASLSIAHNASGSPSAVTLSGTGVGVPKISLSEASLVMDSTDVGSTSQKTFTVGNTGTGSLSVTAITVTGTDAGEFTVSPTTATIAEGAVAQTVTVTFSPDSGGSKTATLSIAHNASGSPSSVSLNGTGVNPDLQIFGKIAFKSNRDGAFEVYTMNPDGSGQTRLTNSPNEDGWPSWSPDGTEIAFMSHRDGNPEIYVMNSDGTNQTRLTNNGAEDSWPFWSPDGTKIAFSSKRDDPFDIYVMNADGTNPTRITNNPAEDNWSCWSPDGAKLPFSHIGMETGKSM